MVGVAGLVAVASIPGLHRAPVIWIVIAVGRLAIQFTDWHGVDDHEVLISYACLALGLAFATSDPARTAARSLPMLVGLTMTFATAWKIGGGQFLDGDTLRYTLLTDPRFDLAGEWFGGLSSSDLAANDRALEVLRAPAAPSAVSLIEPPRATWVALGLSWGGVALEGALAVLFLRRTSSPRLRAVVLAVFCVATYLVVPVTRFGLVLVACSYAGSAAREDRRILLATAAFCIVWAPIWVALGGTTTI